MTYNFNIDISSFQYEIKISSEDNYGYFEHKELGDNKAGGLWFDGADLIDYDGVWELPKEVETALITAGYKGDILFEEVSDEL